MSFIRRIFEQRRPVSEAVKSTYYGGLDWPDFPAALEAYRNPMIALAVDSIVGSVLSTGFYFTSESSEAAGKVGRWAEKTGLRGLLFEVVRELVLTGNSFLRPEGRGENLQLARIPLTFIKPKFDFVAEGEKVSVTYYYVEVKIGSHYQERKLPAEDVIHLAWNVLDPSRPWGYGIAYQLVTRQRDWAGRELPSLLEAEATLRRDLVLYLNRAIPKRLVRVEAGEQEMRDKIMPEISEVLRDPGADWVTNMKFEVSELKAPELKFQHYSVFENMFVAALRSPVVKLFTTPGFTEASAKEATGLFELYVNSVREYLEHVLETKVFPLVTAEKVEIHWGQPARPELRFADIIQAARADAYNPALITRDEARRMLRELGWIVEEEGGAAESVGGRRVLDTFTQVEIQLVPPDDVDTSTIRYYTLDSERGISMAVAWVKSLRDRRPVALFFDKRLYAWDRDRARDYYANVFPTVLESGRYL